MSDLRGKFDENLVGIARELLKDPVLRSSFQDPEFVDDVKIEGIGGSDDHIIVSEASKHRRMIITNDGDFALIPTIIKYGAIILRGGVKGEINNIHYTFRGLNGLEKIQVITALLTSPSHIEAMQNIRNNGEVKIADLNGTCALVGEGRFQAKELRNIEWLIRDVTAEDKKSLFEFKNRNLEKKAAKLRKSLTTDQNQTTSRPTHIDIPENTIDSQRPREGSEGTLSTSSPITPTDTQAQLCQSSPEDSITSSEDVVVIA